MHRSAFVAGTLASLAIAWPDRRAAIADDAAATVLAQDAVLQSEALRLGNPTYLSSDEARRATHTQAGLVSRAWDLWKRALPAR